MLPSYRYFFALFPDAEARALTLARGQALQQALELRGHLLPAHKLHTTVHFIGSFARLSSEIEGAALSAGDRLAGSPFVLAFDHATSFGSNRRQAPAVLAASAPPAELIAIEGTLRQAMTQAGLAPEARPYLPHVTLLYSPDKIAGQLSVEPVAWPVREFCLVRSVPGAESYEMLRSWPLAAAA